jgi:hypothetical protein
MRSRPRPATSRRRAPSLPGRPLVRARLGWADWSVSSTACAQVERARRAPPARRRPALWAQAAAMERVLRAAADRARDFCRASEAAASASRAGSPQRPRAAGGSPDGRLGALVAEGESAYASMPPAGKVAAIAAKFAGAGPGPRRRPCKRYGGHTPEPLGFLHHLPWRSLPVGGADLALPACWHVEEGLLRWVGLVTMCRQRMRDDPAVPWAQEWCVSLG